MRRTAAGLSTVVFARCRSISLRSSDTSRIRVADGSCRCWATSPTRLRYSKTTWSLSIPTFPSGAVRCGTPAYPVGRRYRILPVRPTAPHRRTRTPPSGPPANVDRMSTEEKSAAPRSLAEALRVRDDVSLAALLRSRPDLITPVPTDLTQLATRAGTRASVVRALERLDRFTLQTAEALAVAPDPASYGELLALMAGDEQDPAVAAALPRAAALLREQALVWGADDRLRLVRTARELLSPSPQHPSPTGLGPTVREATAALPGRIQEILAAVGLPSTHDSVSAVSALGALFADRRRMAALLAGLPAESREVLDRLVWGPPYGQVTHDPAAHLRALLDRGLLLPTAPGTVVLPREVALHLRAGRAHRVPSRCRRRWRRPPRTVHRWWTPPRPGRPWRRWRRWTSC
ncbi:hypothetical protein SVIOM342S_00567 [Streptomyces violaceorubidus]